MNSELRNEYKRYIEAALPEIPASYTKMVSDTIAALRRKDQETEKNTLSRSNTKTFVKKSLLAAAACILVLFAVGCTLTIYPAAAAEVPILNSIVYELSPTKEAGTEEQRKISDRLSASVAAFVNGEFEKADSIFYSKTWMENMDNLVAVSYLNYLGTSNEVLPDGTVVTADEVQIHDVQATCRAYLYTANVSFTLIEKGETRQSETAVVLLRENLSGIWIESIEMQSEGYRDYRQQYQDLLGDNGLVPSLDFIKTDNALLQYKQFIANATTTLEAKEQYLLELEESIQSIESQEGKTLRLELIATEKDALASSVTSEITTAEALAAELMYRYYAGRLSGQPSDFSDIMVRNEKTDLFFYDAALAADKVRLGLFEPLETVEKGYAQILETIGESNEEIILRMYVKTEIDYGIGEEIILTLQKVTDGSRIIGYDRSSGDGVYISRLKPLSERYQNEGMNWEEANRQAYQDLYDEVVLLTGKG